jgi:predicted Zn-dependent protease with MMP-like domain
MRLPVERDTFEALVAEAIDDLPEEFARYLENVQVIVEDEPSPQLLRSLGLSPQRDTLYGLYQGVPLSHRGAWFGNHLPDTITIFYQPLVRRFFTAERIRREIQKTVVHEVAHFFGLDEPEIRRLGY